MIFVDFQNCFILILLCFFSFLGYSLFFKKPNNSPGYDLPPSPPSLPIIGHLPLLFSSLTHKSLQKLSTKYGPLLHIRIFNVPVILASSASVAYEIFKSHDVNVSSRDLAVNVHEEDHHHQVARTTHTREVTRYPSEELHRFYSSLLEKARENESVEISKEAMKLMNNTLCRMMLGRCFTEENGEAEKELFIGGTDTSVQTTQWTMAEIINNHKVLEKLREEIDSVVGRSKLIQETDLPNLPYLQAVVKEGLRLHPPAPLMLRKFQERCEIKGFYIPEKTILVISVYAVMRDPDSWEDPEEFKPERFLSPKEDEKQQELKFLPFGGGRRGCPGGNLSRDNCRDRDRSDGAVL
ncbi:hypothetical protein Bca4012_068442 [Brassica carinata]